MADANFRCRWALLGLSSIAVTFVEDLLLARDASDPITHELACVSTTGTDARALGWLQDRKVPSPASVKVYHSAEDMLANGAFDVVYISTPHPLHYQETLLAIKHGRNILVEKPATMNRPQFERLVDAAKRANVVLMEAMWTRYLPAVLHLQQTILPQVAPVRRVFADLSVPIASDDMPITSRLLDKKAGAGAILDMGVYALTWADIALGLSPATTVAYASTVNYDTGKELIDDINTIVLTNPENGGAVAIVTTSLTLAGSNKVADKLAVAKVAPSVRIEGSRGQVSVPFPLIRPQQLQVEWYDDARLDADNQATKEVIAKPVARGWGLWYEADVIARAVRDQKQSKLGRVIGEAESLRVLGWMDEVRKQAKIAYDADLEAL